MAKEVKRKHILQAAKAGYDKFKTFRGARHMFIDAYVGPYFNKTTGLHDQELVNLFFQAIRTTLFHVASKSPVPIVTTEDPDLIEDVRTAQRELEQIVRRFDFAEFAQQWMVEAFFSVAIAKAGIKSSSTMVTAGDVALDPGEEYVAVVDLDNFVVDPLSKDSKFQDAFFVGDVVYLPRQELLDIEDIDRDLVMKLPVMSAKQDPTENNQNPEEFADHLDLVRCVNMWLPKMNQTAITPHWDDLPGDKWLLEQDYIGPDTGPYAYLSFSPPTPGHAMTTAPAGMFFDLHRAVNKVFKKFVSQAARQRDVTFYERGAVDEASEIQDSEDDAFIAVNNANSIRKESFGGANNDNVNAIGLLSEWFNFLAGNPEQAAGLRSNADSATAANILASGANVAFQDMTNSVYAGLGKLLRILWYYRYVTPFGNYKTVGREHDMSISIKARSMAHVDPNQKNRILQTFATNTMPAAVQSASLAFQAQIPFNLQEYLTDIADQQDISDHVNKWFEDPTFAERTKLDIERAIAVGAFKEQAREVDAPGADRPFTDVAQNNGNPQARPEEPDDLGQFNQEAQAGAVTSQREIKEDQIPPPGFFGG